MIYIIALIVAIVLVAIYARPDMRADRSRDRDGQSYWRCAACGAEAFTEGKPPADCLRP
jgi:hypothetical protein